MASEKARDAVKKFIKVAFDPKYEGMADTYAEAMIAAIVEAERGPVQHLGYISGAVDDFAAGRISASKFAELLGARDPQAFKQRCMTYGDEERGEDDTTLRRLLWLRHGCPMSALYGDDGEMSCGMCSADFKRWTPDEISAYFTKRGLEKLAQERGEPSRGSEQPLSSGEDLTTGKK